MAKTACDRLIAAKNLQLVWKDYWPKVKNSSAGVDGITPTQFDEHIQRNIKLIREEMKEGYSFSSLRGVRVPKKDPNKFRIICVPSVQDRLVQRAILPFLERQAHKLGICNDVSYGFIKDTLSRKRGTSGAIAAAIRHRQNSPWAFRAFLIYINA